MAYLLLNDDENILINKVGESIYLRSYPQKYNQKTSVLGKSVYGDYCASIDQENKIHLIYKTSQNSILHLYGKDMNFSSSTLLEDLDNSYKITNLQIVSGKKSYLFYAALNPYENTTDLIFHNFSDGPETAPKSLIELPSLNAKYQSFIFRNKIYLLCSVLNNNTYELNLYQYNINENSWDNYSTLIVSEYPITDFCAVAKQDNIHITYVIEKYGHFTLYYGQQKQDQFISVEITAIGQKIKPVIFIYNGVIWINYLTSQTLYSSFSNSGGITFSTPIKCTLQNSSISSINIYGYKGDSLYGNIFLGYIDHQPNIAVLSQIDVDRILFYSNSNTELREMLKASSNNKKSHTEEDRVKKMQKEIEELKELQKSITEQYYQLASFTKEVQFEGKKWRKKYQKLSKELKETKEIKPFQTKQLHDEEVPDLKVTEPISSDSDFELSKDQANSATSINTSDSSTH